MAERVLSIENIDQAVAFVDDQAPTSADFTPEEWITSTEAAELTGYSASNFQKASKRGRLDSILRGHTRFYRKSDVLEYVRKMKELGSSKHALNYSD